MFKNPPYILQIVKYLYKNYYKISQNKLEVYSRKYKIYSCRKIETAIERFHVVPFIVVLMAFTVGFVALYAGMLLWSFTLEYSLTFIFHLILFDPDTL